MTDLTQPVIISDEDQQKVWDIFNDDTLTDDEKEEQMSMLPENIQNWSTQMFYYAFLDNTSELAAKQRKDESKESSEMT